MSLTTSITINRKAQASVSYVIDTNADELVLSTDGTYKPETLSMYCYRITGGTKEPFSGIVGMLFYDSSFACSSCISSGDSLVSCLEDKPIPADTALIECVFFDDSINNAAEIYASIKKGSNPGQNPIPLCSKKLSVVSDGATGSAGPTIRPLGVWTSGMALVNNSQYIDVVYVEDADGNPVFYKLKDSYSTNSGFTTSSPDSDSTHYVAAQNLGFVATSVLLGKSGYIKVLGSAQILVSNDGTSGWRLTSGAITHTTTGVSLTSDGYLNDPTGLHLKVGGVTSNTILQPQANLIADPIFQFGSPYTGIYGSAVANSTMSGYIEVLGNTADSLNYFSPWQGDGGQLLRVGITANSFGEDVNVFAMPIPPTGEYRIKLIAGKTYCFSVWLKISNDDSSVLASSALLAEVNFWSDETTLTERTTPVHVYISNKCGSVGGFTQYYAKFTVPDGYEYFTWLPLFTVAKNKSNFFISYAACKLEMSDVPTQLNFNAGNAVTKKLLQTGIDIEEQQIVVTADNFKVQNNAGKETFYVDEYGNACLAGYLSENTNVIRCLDDFLSTFIPCANVVEVGTAPSTETVTYYDNAIAVSVSGAQVLASENGWVAAKVINESVYHGSTVVTDNTIGAALDMRCASGIISLDWSPVQSANGNVLPAIIVLPFMGVVSSGSCYGLSLGSSSSVGAKPASDIALALRPSYNYSGSSVFADKDMTAAYDATITNTNVYHDLENDVTMVNGVQCNTVVPPGYSVYFNIRGNLMAGSSTVDTGSYRYAANAMVYTNSKSANRFMKSVTAYFYWEKADGTRTTAKSYAQLVSEGSSLVNSSYKALIVNSTYVKLYAFIRIVVGPNRDDSNSTESYDTNHTLFCSYATYDMNFVRTATTMNKLGLHYINYQEILSLIGHRFVLVNNTGTDIYVINRADKGAGTYLNYAEDPVSQNEAMIKIPVDTSMGFTMVCEDYELSDKISGLDVRYPIIYWQPDAYYNGMLKNSDLSTNVWGGEIYLTS